MCIVNSPFVYNSYGSSYFLCVSLTPPFVFNSSASSYFLCVLLSIHSHYYKDVSADVVQNPCKPNYCKLRVAYTILITVPKSWLAKKGDGEEGASRRTSTGSLYRGGNPIIKNVY